MTRLFTIKQLAAFLKRADLLITNDNGPMHIAAAVGTKVLALFNKDVIGSNPIRWAPYGEGHTIFYNPLDKISPEEVIRAAKDALL
jgi:ADP-heptose:LPS heptosyltransferase